MIKFDFSQLGESGQYHPHFGMICWLPSVKYWELFNVHAVNYEGKGKSARIKSWDAIRSGEDGQLIVRDLGLDALVPLSDENTYYLGKISTQGEYVDFIGQNGTTTIIRRQAKLIFKVDRCNEGLMYKYKKRGYMPLIMNKIRHKFVEDFGSGEYLLPKTKIL